MEAALVTRVSPRQRSIEPRACRRKKTKTRAQEALLVVSATHLSQWWDGETCFLEFKHDIRRLAVRLLKKSFPFASFWLLVRVLISGFLCHHLLR
jgi:hypothetical protein